MKRWLGAVGIILLLGLSLAGCPRGEPAVTPAPPSTSGDGEPRDAAPIDTSSGETPNSGETATSHDPPDDASPHAAWLAKLGSEDREELAAATDHFAKLPDDATAIFFAHRGAADDDVRRGAIFGLYSRFDPDDSQYAAAMVEALGDDDRGVRHVALEAINKMPKKSLARVIPQLAPRLSSAAEPDPQLRAQIARLLARQKTAAQAALPALNDAVKQDPDFNVRSAALFAIYNVARNAEEALPAPTHALASDRDPRLRRIAAERLGKYGAAAAPAVPQLVAALADNGIPARAADDPLRGQDEPVCLAAVASLAQIGQPAVAALTAELTSENRQVRVLAIRTLGDIGPAASSAAPALQKAAAASDPTESAAAKTALAKIAG